MTDCFFYLLDGQGIRSEPYEEVAHTAEKAALVLAYAAYAPGLFRHPCGAGLAFLLVSIKALTQFFVFPQAPRKREARFNSHARALSHVGRSGMH